MGPFSVRHRKKRPQTSGVQNRLVEISFSIPFTPKCKDQKENKVEDLMRKCTTNEDLLLEEKGQ